MTLAVQVKARMSTASGLGREGVVAFVRAQTFRTRDDLGLLLLAVDVDRGARPGCLAGTQPDAP